jgi:hypothetical protein
VIDAKKGTLPGISTMYHYQYEFTEADVFVGIRVFNHEGIGCDKFYTAKECDSMLLEHEGLNESTVGELRMATSTLQEGDLARQRAEGQGARLLRGEEHKDFDTERTDNQCRPDVRVCSPLLLILSLLSSFQLALEHLSQDS